MPRVPGGALYKGSKMNNSSHSPTENPGDYTKGCVIPVKLWYFNLNLEPLA